MAGLNKKNKGRLSVIHFFLILVFFLHGIAFGNDISVTTTGIGKDRNNALLAAKRSAIEKGIGTLIFSETEVKNYMVKKDIILSKTMGSVKKYTLIRENKTPDGLFEVEIHARVSSGSINKDLHALGILMESMEKPRVMVLVNEQIEGNRTHTCETIVTNKLKAKNFNMVDPATVAAIFQNDENVLNKIISGDKAAIVQIGSQNGAEVILTGNVTLSLAEQIYGMNSGQADITIQAILCSSGTIISSKTIHGAAAHISQETAMVNAIKDASSKIFQDRKKGSQTTSLFDDIIGSWQDMQNNGKSIIVTVKNVDTFTIYKAVKSFMENLDENMVKVIQRGWNKPDLELEVVYKGTTDSLSEKMDGKIFSSSKTISVSNLTAGTVTAEIK